MIVVDVQVGEDGSDAESVVTPIGVGSTAGAAVALRRSDGRRSQRRSRSGGRGGTRDRSASKSPTSPRSIWTTPWPQAPASDSATSPRRWPWKARTATSSSSPPMSPSPARSTRVPVETRPADDAPPEKESRGARRRRLGHPPACHVPGDPLRPADRRRAGGRLLRDPLVRLRQLDGHAAGRPRRHHPGPAGRRALVPPPARRAHPVHDRGHPVGQPGGSAGRRAGALGGGSPPLRRRAARAIRGHHDDDNDDHHHVRFGQVDQRPRRPPGPRSPRPRCHERGGARRRPERCGGHPSHSACGQGIDASCQRRLRAPCSPSRRLASTRDATS